MTKLTPNDESARIQRFRMRLTNELNQLLLLRESSSESRAAVHLDQQSVGRLSRVDAMQSQQIAIAADRQRQRQIARIQRALSQMDSGEFGRCLDCDNDIAERRLEADPATPLCVSCASLRAV
ncbi:TraR/DksA family transcriptional regulator [Nitrobacter winogradskyi]|uniref:DnaK suppressor protein n=1 Tax=Nitrobacter winogradskyi TaxID=913 RepID=A0ACC6AIG0_NITWI|nr:TraR/DksA C4-type zinc finger protein [Nitrobacter winogradskyi]MCP1999633.1 DnaK suppressor protein [Nitrobacter winogradskyi]